MSVFFSTNSYEDNLSENTSEDDNDDDIHASEYDATIFPQRSG